MTAARLIVAIAGLGLAAVCTVIMIRRRMGPSGTKRGMKQFARDPEARRAAGEFFARRKELLKQAPWMGEAKIRRAVERVLGDDEGRRTYGQVLEEVGPRAEPMLLAALDDPRAAPAVSEGGVFDESAFETLVDVLASMGSQPLIPRLVPLLSSPEEELRKLAALAIAKVGGDAAVEPMLRALSDPEEYVRNYAMMGIAFAAKGGRVTPAYRERVFARLAEIASGTTEFNTYHDADAIEYMVKLDRARTEALLATPQYLRVDHPQLSELLRHANQAKLRLVPALLMPIIAHAGLQRESIWGRIRGEALTALARVEPESARPDIQALLRDGDADARAQAAAAIREMEGLPEPWSLWRDDLQSLPREAQHVAAVYECEAEVSNGGFSQYFFNPGGGRWALALDALRAMKASRSADILDRAARVLGRHGPSTDREARIEKYAQLSDEREKVLDDLSREFWSASGERSACVTEYMLGHKTMFAPLRESGDGSDS